MKELTIYLIWVWLESVWFDQSPASSSKLWGWTMKIRTTQFKGLVSSFRYRKACVAAPNGEHCIGNLPQAQCSHEPLLFSSINVSKEQQDTISRRSMQHASWKVTIKEPILADCLLLSLQISLAFCSKASTLLFTKLQLCTDSQTGYSCNSSFSAHWSNKSWSSYIKLLHRNSGSRTEKVTSRQRREMRARIHLHWQRLQISEVSFTINWTRRFCRNCVWDQSQSQIERWIDELMAESELIRIHLHFNIF